ncbi:hypothetical protein WN48_11378 [Eufriesea mexicana]|uniref:Uncharacterized protein n=1 Tax=Eufriesea mexicana TaxID=516756 RepID=A0A310SR13_9HYME|nr:hypothetical protein WN48_11378 [Eufriesea mexicana]
MQLLGTDEPILPAANTENFGPCVSTQALFCTSPDQVTWYFILFFYKNCLAYFIGKQNFE